MKQIALLGFILVGLPILFTACDKCRPGKAYFYTYSKIENHLVKQNFIDSYEQNDTVTEDTIRVRMHFEHDFIAKNEIQNTSNAYSVLACEPAEPKIKNKIQNLIFGLFLNSDTLNINSALLNSLVLRIPEANYNWPQNKDAFFAHFNIAEPYRVNAFFLSPHNSKNIQFVTWAIKENGDTLKAISQKVFCK